MTDTTTELLSAAATAPAAPVILGVSPTTGASTSLTTDSNLLTLTGSAVSGSTVTIYNGSTELGTATANAQGVWSYTTSALADGAYAFSATDSSNGATSASSSTTNVTVDADISSFSPITDLWSKPISVGGLPYAIENANINGNAPWAVTEVNDHTLEFTYKPGDTWEDNDSDRTEISGETSYATTATVNVSYQLTVQPGVADTGLDWQVIGQMHAVESTSIVEAMSQDPPIFSFSLRGPNGTGGGDYLTIGAYYLPAGSENPVLINTDSAGAGLYVSPTPIVRGQPYAIQVQASFQDNANGFVEVWINGVQVVDYHGPVGYGTPTYWKEGVYEGYSPTQTITVDYANTTVTATPYAPVITSDTVNGSQAMLGGTAESNSTVSIYDGSTLLGTVKAAGSGSWSYETSTLATGAHSFTATATDSAGNVSPASLASSVTVSAFTGPIVTGVTASAVTGEALVGQNITFTLAMSEAATVTGAPTLTLSDGGTATYVSGSGTNALTFQYVVGAGDSSTSGLSITGVSLPTGASITDASGNAAILVGADQTFASIVVDTAPVSAPVFVSSTANANGSITIKGTAAPNTIVHEIETVYSGTSTLSLNGTAVVNSAGSWTYTTPSLVSGVWYGLSAYDTNALGDVSATTTNNGDGVTTSDLPSPVITSSHVSGGAVTLSGVIPAKYGSTGPSGATVLIFDGSTELGSATSTSGGNWTFTSSQLTNGVHTFTVESQNASGVSAPSLPESLTVTGGGTSTGSSTVTVSDFLANQSTLDAAGSFTISDTATAVASAIDVSNADSHVSAITLLGGATLSLDVAQALDDTRALGLITNSNYSVSITDTGADVAANFDALNADSHISAILPTGGSQTLNLTLTQILNDTHAISLLDPFLITVTGAAASLNALSSGEIGTFATDGVTELAASDADLTLSLAQRQALGANGISILEPFAGGTTEMVTYAANGSLASAVYQGVTGAAYTSYTVNYGSNGKAATATYSDGMTESWTYNANGSYSVKLASVPGQAYTSYTVNYGTNGKATSATYSDGMSESWTYNANGTYSIQMSGVPGQAYTSYTVNYGTNGKPTSETFSNGMTESWTYNGNGSYAVKISGVSGQAYTSYTLNYGTNGKAASATFSDGMTETWTYNANGTYAVKFTGVPGQAYTSYTVNYGTNGKAASATFSNGMSETWTYNANGSYSIKVTGVPGQAYTSYTVNYGTNGKPTSATYSDSMTESWTYNSNGSYAVKFAGVPGQAYTTYTVNYGTNGKPTSATYGNGMTAAWTYNTDGSWDVAYTNINSSYSWREAMYNASGALVGNALDATSGTGQLNLTLGGVTVSSSASALSVKAGADTFALHHHATETINATAYGSETFSFTSGFGTDTIQGFAAGGTGGDVLSLQASMFKGLSVSNTVAQNVALLLSGDSMVQSGANVKLTDTSGDVLTLTGITTSALSQYASSAFKFA